MDELVFRFELWKRSSCQARLQVRHVCKVKTKKRGTSHSYVIYNFLFLHCPSSFYTVQILLKDTFLPFSPSSLSLWAPQGAKMKPYQVGLPTWMDCMGCTLPHLLAYRSRPTDCSHLCASPFLLIHATHLPCHSNELIYFLKWRDGAESQ